MEAREKDASSQFEESSELDFKEQGYWEISEATNILKPKKEPGMKSRLKDPVDLKKENGTDSTKERCCYQASVGT